MKTIASIIFFSAAISIWAQGPPADPGAPPMAGIHWARGQAGAGASSAPLLLYHGGPIMKNSTTMAIFWGASWGDSSFVGDKITGIDSFYNGEGGSTYAATVNEYNDSTGTFVSSASTYAGHLVDLSAATKNGNRTSPILQEVCTVLGNNHITPVASGFYAVYVDTPRGHAGFCAWHSAGTCNGVPIQFAFFFNLDGDPGCDPQDNSGSHSQGLSALANVTGHELSEARSDPQLNAWYDSSGAENADKCAWSFGTPLLTFSNKTQWKIQGNWSNAAFNAGTGFSNSSGQNGCIDGGNFK